MKQFYLALIGRIGEILDKQPGGYTKALERLG
jgi:hypothetical protein